MTKEKTTIKDLYKGEYLNVWEDEEWVTVSIFPATISMPKEDWETLKKDFKKVK